MTILRTEIYLAKEMPVKVHRNHKPPSIISRVKECRRFLYSTTGLYPGRVA